MRSGWDRWATVYARLEYLLHGRRLEAVRRLHLDALPDRGRWLLLGVGDGRFLEEALPRGRAAQWVAMDLSAGMLARARARVGTTSRVEWCQADVRALPPKRFAEGAFAGVVSQFFFDVFTPAELAAWFPGVAGAVVPGGRWLVADYAPPEDLPRGARERQQLLLRGLLYPVFRATTGMRARALPDLAAPFRTAGWTRLVETRTTGPACLVTEWRKPCHGGSADGTVPG